MRPFYNVPGQNLDRIWKFSPDHESRRRTGRLHRLHPGKHEVRIVDYVDSKVPMLARMSEKRRVGYRAMEYREHDDRTLLV
jgi:superfamily II DNA or RNA helicase